MRACSGHPWAYYSGPEGEYRVCRECGRVEAGSEDVLRKLGAYLPNAGVAREEFAERARAYAASLARYRGAP